MLAKLINSLEHSAFALRLIMELKIEIDETSTYLSGVACNRCVPLTMYGYERRREAMRMDLLQADDDDSLIVCDPIGS